MDMGHPVVMQIPLEADGGGAFLGVNHQGFGPTEYIPCLFRQVSRRLRRHVLEGLRLRRSGSRFERHFKRLAAHYVSIRSCQKPWMTGSPGNPPPTVRPSPRYLAQVKAFLSYIEDVEVDEETIEDILTGLEEEFDPPVTSDGEQSGAEPDTVDRDGVDNELAEDEDEVTQEGLVYCYTNCLPEGLIWTFAFSKGCMDRGRGQADNAIFETTW